jgi:peptidoglycan/LPS O-acetylase OafA/YrhL
MRTSYRADIDGLRAVAVGAVLLYHAEVPGLGGGYVGVDVFFVISGYLITLIIAGDLAQDQFSIREFYERRIRRIFPAFFAMLGVVLALGALVFDPRELATLGLGAVAATAFASNVLFWRQSGYFAPAAETNPLLHTWSLAVEEQFYLLFPMIMIIMFRLCRRRVSHWLVGACVLSFALSIYGVARHPSATFFLLPTRAWELLVGSLLAIHVSAHSAPIMIRRTIPQFGATLVALTGALLILAAVLGFTDRTPFPGLAALVPVAGAAAVIWSGSTGQATLLQRLLSTRPLVVVGKASYSVYLWHWPVVAFWKYLSFTPLSVTDAVVIIAISLVLGFLSLHWIERPFRGHSGRSVVPGVTLGLGATAMMIAVGTGGLLWVTSGVPARPWIDGTHTQAVTEATDDSAWRKWGDWEFNVQSIGVNPSTEPSIVGMIGTTPTFALLGDSHARALIPAIDVEARRAGVSSYIITRHSAPPLLGVGIERVPLGDDGFDEASFYERVTDFLSRRPTVKTVFLAARWPAYVRDHYTERGEDQLDVRLFDADAQGDQEQSRSLLLERGLNRMISRLRALGCRVVIVGCVPEIGIDVPRAFSLAGRLPWLVDLRTVTPSRREVAIRQAEVSQVLSDAVRQDGVYFVDPASGMWDAQDRVVILHHGRLLYRDDDHLSDFGAIHVAPSFAYIFDEAARDQRP